MDQVMCLRCGNCCRNYFCLVPKNIDSDLSDKFLDEYIQNHSFDEMQNYISENQEFQGEKCKWLKQDQSVKSGDSYNDIAYCTAYNHRSSMCSDYMKDQHCNIGLMMWKRHQTNGYDIPKEILNRLKQHKLYQWHFGRD